MQKLNLEDILKNTSDFKEKKVGYVSIIGRPNVGKSTFLNAIVGEKVSIVSKIPQTTRKKILGIFNDEESQIIFIDTPGIHKNEKLFNQEINNTALNSLENTDLILYFIDSSRPNGEEEKYLEELLSNIKKPILKIYTKTDLSPKIDFEEDILKISSFNNEGLFEVISEIKKYLQKGQILFPEDYFTTGEVSFILSEVVREKVFLNTKDEIPHSSFVEIGEIEEKEGLLKILATIFVETESQKTILIGKKGQMVAKIGKEAREELEKVYYKKVFLALRIKVKPNWRKDEKLIKKLLK